MPIVPVKIPTAQSCRDVLLPIGWMTRMNSQKTSADRRASIQWAFVDRAKAAPRMRWLGSASKSSSSVEPAVSNFGTTAGYSFFVCAMRSFRSSEGQKVETARGISATSRPQRAILLQPSGREGGRGAALRRRGAGAAEGAALAAGTAAPRPQAGEAMLRAMKREGAESRAPQGQAERIFSSAAAAGGRAPP